MIVEMSVDEAPTARSADRIDTVAAATIRPFRARPESVRIVNISTDGCGFESGRPFREGMTVLLYLPGLQPWPATVRWWKDGRGGAAFARKLAPSAVERFAESVGSEK